MNAKIDWYKEILEIEPDSRLFLPLAKMLVDAGEDEEACQVLARGVTRHEDFLEARLFYIEVLRRLNRETDCAQQVSAVCDIFTKYSGFWQAWAARVKQTDCVDNAIAMRLLGLVLRNVEVNFSDIINRGLDSLEAELAAKEQVQPSQEVQEEETIPLIEQAEIASVPSLDLAQQEQFAEPTLDSDNGVYTPMSEPVSMAADFARSLEKFAQTKLSQENEQSSVPSVPQAQQNRSQEETVRSAETKPLSVEEAVQGLKAEQANSAEEEALAVRETVSRAFGAFNRVMQQTPTQQVQAAPVSADKAKPKTLRTRSMAEVLVEQGDIKAAIGIYEELVAAAATDELREQLSMRLQTLLGLANANKEEDISSELSQPEPEVQTQRPRQEGKELDEKLISMLETLAERVEARAHS